MRSAAADLGPGTVLRSGTATYHVIRSLTPEERSHAKVYLCQDKDGVPCVAKHFHNGRPTPVLGYARRNHYGRRRDGSALVFHEIRKAAEEHPFLVAHRERFRHAGRWVIIQDHVDGTDLKKYIEDSFARDRAATLKAVEALARTLTCWHAQGFAHGDPHLGNALIHTDPAGATSVTLIDYGLIHHADFHYCRKYGCFDPPSRRMEEDLEQPSGNLGRGFRDELKDLGDSNGLGTLLVDHFDKHYIPPAPTSM